MTNSSLDVVLSFTAGVIGRSDPEKVAHLLAEDAVAHLPVSLEPEPFRGRARIMEFMSFAATVFDNESVSYEVTHTAVDGDTMFISLEVSARFRTIGQNYRNFYCFRYTVRDGLIQEYREYTDSKYAASFVLEP